MHLVPVLRQTTVDSLALKYAVVSLCQRRNCSWDNSPTFVLHNSVLPRQNCEVQRLANWHIDSLFFDKVKPSLKYLCREIHLHYLEVSFNLLISFIPTKRLPTWSWRCRQEPSSWKTWSAGTLRWTFDSPNSLSEHLTLLKVILLAIVHKRYCILLYFCRNPEAS